MHNKLFHTLIITYERKKNFIRNKNNYFIISHGHEAQKDSTFTAGCSPLFHPDITKLN